MLLFLYGKETYQLQEKLKEIKEHYQEKYKESLAFEEKDALLITIQDLKDLFFQRSFFAKKTLIFLDNLFLNEGLKNDFLKDIDKFSQAEDFLVISQKGVLPDKASLKLLKQAGTVQEFKPLKRGKVRVWLREKIESTGFNFSEEALDLLLDSSSDDLWRLANEVGKITAFKKNNKGSQIRCEDVRMLVKPAWEDSLFKTVDALAKRNKKEALRLIRENLLKRHSPVAVLTMIVFQFRGLLLAKTFQEQGRSLDNFISLGLLKPFPARKSWYASNNFTQEQLKKIYQKIFEIDVAIKQGLIDQDEGLKMLVSEI
jgi:DNA polymerase III subunit delta